jgi:hypothetical protein
MAAASSALNSAQPVSSTLPNVMPRKTAMKLGLITVTLIDRMAAAP